MKILQTNIKIIDGDRGKNYPTPNELLTSGYCLFLNNKNIVNNKLSLIDSNYISEQKHNKLSKGSLNRKDLVSTTRGSLGNLLYIDSKFPLPARINSGMVIIQSDESEYRQNYLYYYFQSKNFKDQIAELRTGSAQPQLPIKDFQHIDLLEHSLFEQQHIVNSINCEVKYAC